MKVLHASKIGFPCARNLWYAANEFEGVVSQHSTRIFDVGNALEPMVVKWLRDDGWEVEYNPGSQSAELEVVVPLPEGELRGHPDAFISKGDKQNTLIDIKTMNDRAFKLWKRNGTLEKYPQYVDQLHVYALGLMNTGRAVEELGVVGVNKNTSEMQIDIFPFSRARAVPLLKRARQIFGMTEPPENNCPGEVWACGYCEFSHSCELYKKKNDKTVGEEVTITDDAEIIDAMELLRDARVMAKDARDLEVAAKAILDATVRQQGLKSVQGGEFTLTLKESYSNNFDTTAFKKAHPEMVSEFTKRTQSLKYELEERS